MNSLTKDKLLILLQKVDSALLKRQLEVLMCCIDGKQLAKGQLETLCGLENFISELLSVLNENSK